MKPIYFPFTYVSRQTARAISVYFKSMVVYQASARPLPSEMLALVESGFLDVRVPDPSGQSRFDNVVKNFRSWASLHFNGREMKTVFSRSAEEPIPFFNESAASQLVADIKDELNSNPTSKAPDALFDARIFMEFAQEFDRQSHDIHQGLGAYDEKIKHLFADIKGANHHPVADNLSAANISKNNPEEYLILRRLEAWTYLFQKDAAASGILLAGSRTLLEHILDKIPTAKKIHTYNCVPDPEADTEALHLWRDNLMATLTSLVKAGRPAATDMPVNEYPTEPGGPGVSLSLYLIPNLKPLDCLAACISKPVARSGNQLPTSDIRNTLIGLVNSF